MKIQMNGFDIEINTESDEMSIKVMDATGKELSNNTYAQTLENSDESEVVDPGVEDLPTGEEESSETTEEETSTETEETTEEELPADETTEEVGESLENFKTFLEKNNVLKSKSTK